MPAKRGAPSKTTKKKRVRRRVAATAAPPFRLPPGTKPPKDVTRDLFLVWRMPRVGTRNPQRLTNPVWAWLARNPELTAYHANAHFAGPPSLAVGPCWSNHRFGQSRTTLPDGRIVAIAGEHEDHYDPDFCIYNDVIVLSPSGELQIYGYPPHAFPPTDHHTATLDPNGTRIVVIGNLGYPAARTSGTTPVHVLDTRTFVMSPVETTGSPPGWIHEHTAVLTDDGRSVLVSSGKQHVEVGGEAMIRENADDWLLDLETFRWDRRTERTWREWALFRENRRHNELFTIDSMRWHVENKTPFDREQLARGKKELGFLPDFALHGERYVPPVPHERVPGDETEFPLVVRILVDGIVVRYVEDSFDVRIIVEGPLDDAKVEAIVENARQKLERLEKHPWARLRLR